ncbi:MAG TPA: NUDIX domain-containing protein [Chloroflexota bacterium]|nr:NUDIX domain-containing protein [Chloroflexota bacterium]
MIAAKLYTVVVLFHSGKLLLLRRSSTKTFAPDQWTGIGGRVEPDEFDDLVSAAGRELFEETDLRPTEVSPLALRRTLTFYRPDEGLVTLLYFTGTTSTGRPPAASEGSLAWIDPAALPEIDVIENTARVLPLLVGDSTQPAGRIRCGIARLDGNWRLVDVAFD